MVGHLDEAKNNQTIWSPHASLLIIAVKYGEICLDVGYRKLDSITVHDVFPLLFIDETLEVIYNSM